MITKIEGLKTRAEQEVAAAADEPALRQIEVSLLGKKGQFNGLMKEAKNDHSLDRATFFAGWNTAKQAVRTLVDKRREELKREALLLEVQDPYFDPTLPGLPEKLGAIHPLSKIAEEVEDIFTSMGFVIPDYPEAESEFFNFEALNIPSDHPARDMQDTFWLKDGNLLRTHTSPGQIRAMADYEPPFRAIFPGRVYRYEALDASHEHTFHQLEGLLIDREVSVAHLIHSMKVLLEQILKREVTIRLRPGYFPFVEPGFELDIQCAVCGGKGCSVCKQSGWVELLPCGLVHPNVIRFGGLDPDEWQGWAFGLGLSRLVMMKYQISDIRHLMGGDLRFLEQFA